MQGVTGNNVLNSVSNSSEKICVCTDDRKNHKIIRAKNKLVIQDKEIIGVLEIFLQFFQKSETILKYKLKNNAKFLICEFISTFSVILTLQTLFRKEYQKLP